MRAHRIAAVALPLALAWTAVAAAHALFPSMLAIEEHAPGRAAVTWKTPVLQLPGADLRPVLPPECTVSGGEQLTQEDEAVIARWNVTCPGGFVGKRLAVEGLGAAKTDALLHVTLADGRTIDTVLRAREPYLDVPAEEHRVTLGWRYVALGVEHILTGWDHLLFVFGLLLLASSTRMLVATVTAFTVGHSITLTLAVLDLARVPSAPVEVAIAFSIFVLAVELARPAEPPTLVRRRPWLMALLFGLLHGLGFAGVLREAGLPAAAVPLALLGFNVGIELGQLAFVLAVLGVASIARPLTARLPTWVPSAPVYAMGSLAAFWMIERSTALLR